MGKSPLSGWPFDTATRDAIGTLPLEKVASQTGLMLPTIDSTGIMRDLWQDPFVADRLPLPLRTAGSGLLLGSSHLAGQERGTDAPVRFISPWDVARMTAGMGSGYLAGAAVGRGLQLLTGMPDEQADKLKTTGVWAGALANLIPLAFSGLPH
jgi:hypothetical protein